MTSAASAGFVSAARMGSPMRTRPFNPFEKHVAVGLTRLGWVLIAMGLASAVEINLPVPWGDHRTVWGVGAIVIAIFVLFFIAALSGSVAFEIIGWAFVVCGVFWIPWHGLLPPGVRVALGVVQIGTGMLLLVGGAGLRQNRVAVNFGLFELFASACAMIACGVTRGQVLSPTGAAVLIVAGLGLVFMVVYLYILHSRANQFRFGVRFFSPRQYETLVFVVEALLEWEPQVDASPEDIALAADFTASRSPDLLPRRPRWALWVTGWIAPFLTTGHPLAFTTLGAYERGLVLQRLRTGWVRCFFAPTTRALKRIVDVGYKFRRELR